MIFKFFGAKCQSGFVRINKQLTLGPVDRAMPQHFPFDRSWIETSYDRHYRYVPTVSGIWYWKLIWECAYVCISVSAQSGSLATLACCADGARECVWRFLNPYRPSVYMQCESLHVTLSGMTEIFYFSTVVNNESDTFTYLNMMTWQMW